MVGVTSKKKAVLKAAEKEQRLKKKMVKKTKRKKCTQTRCNGKTSSQATRLWSDQGNVGRKAVDSTRSSSAVFCCVSAAAYERQPWAPTPISANFLKAALRLLMRAFMYNILWLELAWAACSAPAPHQTGPASLLGSRGWGVRCEEEWKIKAEARQPRKEERLNLLACTVCKWDYSQLNCIIYVHNNSIIITGLKLNYDVISISKWLVKVGKQIPNFANEHL